MAFHEELNVPSTLIMSLYSRIESAALLLSGAVVSAEDNAVSSAVATAAAASGTETGA